MCFTVDSSYDKIQKVVGLLYVFKQLKLRIKFDEIGNILEVTIRSPFQNSVYFNGTFADFKTKQPIKALIKGGLKIIDNKIYEGFHSYLYNSVQPVNIIYRNDIFKAMQYNIFSKNVIVTGLIPFNSEYIVNPYTGQIVSNAFLTFMDMNTYFTESHQQTKKYFSDFTKELQQVIKLRKENLQHGGQNVF